MCDACDEQFYVDTFGEDDGSEEEEEAREAEEAQARQAWQQAQGVRQTWMATQIARQDRRP